VCGAGSRRSDSALGGAAVTLPWRNISAHSAPSRGGPLAGQGKAGRWRQQHRASQARHPRAWAPPLHAAMGSRRSPRRDASAWSPAALTFDVLGADEELPDEPQLRAAGLVLLLPPALALLRAAPSATRPTGGELAARA